MMNCAQSLFLALLLTCGMQVGASAQEKSGPRFSPVETEACLAGTEESSSCVGRSAEACIANPDGYTTVGMGFCLGLELDYWDARLNATYGALREVEARADAEMRELGATVPSMAESLRAAQQAWIAFRDADCAHELSQWSGGTGGGPATTQCLMQITGERALALERRLAGKQLQ